MWKKKLVYFLNYLKIFNAAHENNTRMHSPQQNNFKVSTPVRPQRQ